MRVAWLEIQNFRSIESLRIENLDKAQIVIEGQNDVGKSNILYALDLALSTLPTLLRKKGGLDAPIPGEPSTQPDWVRNPISLFRNPKKQLIVSIGIRFDSKDGVHQGITNIETPVAFKLSWNPSTNTLSANLSTSLRTDLFNEAYIAIAQALAPAFRLVGTQRAPDSERLHLSSGNLWETKVRWYGRNLKEMLFLYKNSPDLEIQERFEQLRAAAQSPEMGIGTLNVSVLPDQTLNVKTRFNGTELQLEERGSGIQQLLTLLALSICHRGRILAVEEPEMNLSEPNQRLLWKRLREFSSESGPLDQVFLTSHSRVFEEEAERIVVSYDEKAGTRANWAAPAPLRQSIDEDVLPVTRGGAVTLSEKMLQHLGIKDNQHLYLVPTKKGYHLLGPGGYAEYLGLEEDEEDPDADPIG
ncbi:AAA family ATPase [Corallococcus exiguus]|uniref:ATP-dependent nuclease n=1 Tax=Corallococcus exiguus TaxID=83462 RepID=UPI001471EA82|nr:AAA family ATPase [Corallococcus exiguus]NNB98971.1 AAA family ATPase [Corallococcus exiguus]NNC08124.1 AAA family ATPase [Corallococcus exiguus]